MSRHAAVRPPLPAWGVTLLSFAAGLAGVVLGSALVFVVIGR